MWTLINRQEYAIDGEQLSVPHVAGAAYYDVWNGERIEPRIDGERAILSAGIEANGFAAFLCDTTGEDLTDHLATMRTLTATPLGDLSAKWVSAKQELVPIAPTRIYDTPHRGNGRDSRRRFRL